MINTQHSDKCPDCGVATAGGKCVKCWTAYYQAKGPLGLIDSPVRPQNEGLYQHVFEEKPNRRDKYYNATFSINNSGRG